MADKAPEFQLVTETTADPRFAFQVEVPANWKHMALPQEDVDFSEEGIFQPLAVFMAPYGVVILTLSARPGLGGGTVAEWLTKMCCLQEIETTEIGPAMAGDIQGVGAMGTQPSDAGPMTLRLVLFERGGWAHLLMGMVPSAIWDSLAPTYDRMFGSFAMVHPMPSTIPPWPSDDQPDEQPEVQSDAKPQSRPTTLTPKDLAKARQVAVRFLDALKRGDEPAAKALLVAEDAGSVNFPSISDGAAEFSLGEPQADGALVIVEATLRGCPPGQSQAQDQALPLVLRQADGQWRVDTGASIKRMLGVDLEEAMTDLATGLGQAMADGMKSVIEGLADPPAQEPQEDAPAGPQN